MLVRTLNKQITQLETIAFRLRYIQDALGDDEMAEAIGMMGGIPFEDLLYFVDKHIAYKAKAKLESRDFNELVREQKAQMRGGEL